MNTFKNITSFPTLSLLFALISSCQNSINFTQIIPAPSSLALTSPSSSPNFDTTPIVTVSGIQVGDTIKLFTDSACTAQTGNPTIALAITIDITTSVLPAATYNFYANSTGVHGTSDCSTATVNYILNSCPSGYVMVPANTAVGAPDNFCVMQYEAQKSADNTAVSTNSGAPWGDIDQVAAKAECAGIGANYDLISNPEWMAIARNVENVAENWTGNSVGIGCLKRGNIGGTHACDDGNSGTTASGYNGADPDNVGSRMEDNNTAKLLLDNGNSIFDFSGNIFEWVDWTLGGELSTNMIQADKASIGGNPVAEYLELSALDDFPAHSPVTALLPSDSTFDSTHGMGTYYGDSDGGAAIRGGRWLNGTNAGVYMLDLDVPSNFKNIGIGFRCVFRLTSPSQ